jgi:phenylalanine-4-hydroxylase
MGDNKMTTKTIVVLGNHRIKVKNIRNYGLSYETRTTTYEKSDEQIKNEKEQIKQETEQGRIAKVHTDREKWKKMYKSKKTVLFFKGVAEFVDVLTTPSSDTEEETSKKEVSPTYTIETDHTILYINTFSGDTYHFEDEEAKEYLKILDGIFEIKTSD